MSGLETDTIGGYNSMLVKQQAVSPITEKEYQVGGSTALFDAIGRTIHKIGNAQRYTANDYRAEKVMFIIITDGEKNSSREYSAEKVKAQIERQRTNMAGSSFSSARTSTQFRQHGV